MSNKQETLSQENYIATKEAAQRATPRLTFYTFSSKQLRLMVGLVQL